MGRRKVNRGEIEPEAKIAMMESVVVGREEKPAKGKRR
jgi:hypothetical protein